MKRETSGQIGITAEGIGGIDETAVSLERGVNLLVGRNATNRTSFLQAIMAALGSDRASLKGDREEGRVELEIGSERYTRRLRRTDAGEISFDGDPYLSDATPADLFAFLLETNEARRAVTAAGDLRDVILRPVDTAEIEAEIAECLRERDRVDERIERLEERRDRLPDLTARRQDLVDDLETARDALAEIEADIEAADADLDAERDSRDELEARLSQLTETRNELEQTRYRLETERDAVQSAREELETVEAERETLPEPSEERLAEIEDEISALRREKRTYDSRVSKLHQIIQFNEEMLEEDGLFGEMFETSGENPGGDLLADQTECWTCGSTVDVAAIEEMITDLRDLSERQRARRRELEAELDELVERRDRFERARSREADLADRADRLEANIDQRQETIADLEDEAERLEDRVAELESAVDRLERTTEDRLLDLHRKRNEQELTVERLQRELEDVDGELETLDALAEDLADLRERREHLADRLTALRTRIDRIERESVEAFNDHIETLLELLEYDNLARVWIERTGTGQERSASATFVLHVVRTAADGTSYEDTIDHLSESEREVVGLVFALAGYLAHDVYETIPFMLLDSLEAIDSERIARLVEYLSEYSPIIVAALLREDARALPEAYNRVENI